MLRLHPNCQRCDRDLPADSSQAMICSFECTFCKQCVDHALQGVCPNCGGGFALRPQRPAHQLGKYPAAVERVYGDAG